MVQKVTTSNNKWQAVVQNEWQPVTISDNEWQQVTTSGTTSDNEWQWMTASDNEWPFELIFLFSNKRGAYH